MSLFVTGTDTGVGKTYVSAGLVQTARVLGQNAVGFKPICCGDRDDADALWVASGGAEVLPINDVNPVWFRTPAAPYTAALIENRLVDVALIRERAAQLQQRFAPVIAEGAGGWAVPIEAGLDFAALAVEFGWPVLVVAANRLGALNHTILTVRAIEASGLPCLGVVLNEPRETGADAGVAETTNAGVLEALLPYPVWRLGFGDAPQAICRDVLVRWSESGHNA